MTAEAGTVLLSENWREVEAEIDALPPFSIISTGVGRNERVMQCLDAVDGWYECGVSHPRTAESVARDGAVTIIRKGPQ